MVVVNAHNGVTIIDQVYQSLYVSEPQKITVTEDVTGFRKVIRYRRFPKLEEAKVQFSRIVGLDFRF